MEIFAGYKLHSSTMRAHIVGLPLRSLVHVSALFTVNVLISDQVWVCRSHLSLLRLLYYCVLCGGCFRNECSRVGCVCSSLIRDSHIRATLSAYSDDYCWPFASFDAVAAARMRSAYQRIRRNTPQTHIEDFSPAANKVDKTAAKALYGRHAYNAYTTRLYWLLWIMIDGSMNRCRAPMSFAASDLIRNQVHAKRWNSPHICVAESYGMRMRHVDTKRVSPPLSVYRSARWPAYHGGCIRFVFLLAHTAGAVDKEWLRVQRLSAAHYAHFCSSDQVDQRARSHYRFVERQANIRRNHLIIESLQRCCSFPSSPVFIGTRITRFTRSPMYRFEHIAHNRASAWSRSPFSAIRSSLFGHSVPIHDHLEINPL